MHRILCGLFLLLAGTLWAGPAAPQQLPSPRFQAIDVAGRVTTGGTVAPANKAVLTPYKPAWAYFPTLDLIRYQNLMEVRTSRDGDSWESPLGVEMVSQTGYSRGWEAGAVVALGDNITSAAGVPEPYTYRVLRAGTLGGSAPTAGPGSGPVENGSALLQWINFTNLAAKIGLTNTTIAQGNAGRTWGNNFNYIMNPLSHKPVFMTGTEIDYKNSSGYDCDLFTGSTCNAVTMFMMGQNRSTSAISIGAPGVTGTAAEWGLYMTGRLARDAAVEINTTGGRVGLGFGRYKGIISGAEFSDATIMDESSSAVGLHMRGSYGNSAINLESAVVSGVGVAVPSAIRVKAGQAVCLDASDRCLFFDQGTSKLVYQKGADRLFSVDNSGNVRALGSITANVAP
jgi:hypothetical protein